MDSPFTPEQQAQLEVLAPYLPYGIEVEHAAHGRGILVGLPYCQAPGERPRVEVAFPGTHTADIYELADVKPVLRADGYEPNSGQYADRMREQHRAVGLRPDQFIAKEPA